MLSNTTRPSPRRRPTPLTVLGLVAAVVLAAMLTLILTAVSAPPAGAPGSATPPAAEGAPPIPPGDRGGLDASGRVVDGVTVFDDEYDAVARLDPALLDALRTAATDAAQDGVEFVVNSGWRSPDYQARLLQDAIVEYGSEAEARRWVATPETSQHVSGEAVDLAERAASWLSAHGDAYGLCQIYRNETWHFELRSEAVRDGCPEMYADASQDPRLQQ